MRPEIRDVVPGLWIWRMDHPDWAPHVSWDPPVTSTCVESGGEVGLLDPLAPPEEATYESCAVSPRSNASEPVPRSPRPARAG